MLLALGGHERFERWVALMKTRAEYDSGIRASDWDPRLLQQALAVNDKSGDAIQAHVFAYAYFIDREDLRETASHEDLQQAAVHLEQVLSRSSKLNKSMRALYSLEAAIFHAWYRGDARKARAWLEVAGKRYRRFPLLYRLRPEIALLWVEGRCEEAEAKLDELLNVLEKMPDTAERSLRRQSMEEWREKMHKRLSGAIAAG